MNSRNPSVYARPFSIDNDGDFPRVDQAQTGLDLRTHVAVKAMHAMITGYWSNPAEDNIKAERMAKRAFEYADAFMTEYNRPAVEAEARRNAEIAAGRELVANAAYFISEETVELMGVEHLCRYVYDRKDEAFVCVQKVVNLDTDPAGREWEGVPLNHIPHKLYVSMERMEDQIRQHKPYDLEEWSVEATNDLPEWAQPKD